MKIFKTLWISTVRIFLWFVMIISLCVVFYLSWKFLSSRMNKYEVHLVSPVSVDIKFGNSVQLNGISIGKIIDVKLNKDVSGVIMKALLPKDLNLPNDSKFLQDVTLEDSVFISYSGITIVPGKNEEYIKDGDTINIKIKKQKKSVDLGEIFDKFSDLSGAAKDFKEGAEIVKEISECEESKKDK